MDTEGPNNTVHVGLGEGSTVRMPGLQLYTRKVGGEQTGGPFSLFEVEVGPGGGDGPHVQHREDECFYIVEGRFEFVIEGAGIEAGTGSLVYATRGELHAFENVGEGVASLRERTVAEAGSALGEAAFDEFRARGETMTFDDAVRYALGGDDPPRSDSLA